MIRIILLPAIALLAACVGGCTHDATMAGGALAVPLEYAPEHARASIRPFPKPVPQSRIYVGQFEDRRAKATSIGENIEHATPVPVLAVSDPIEFFRHTLAAQLRQAGLTVVEDPAQADRTIRGDVTQFWVTESNNYEAKIDATIRLYDAEGNLKWQSPVSGKGETFGHSLSPENYREALSDAMVRLTYENLFSIVQFQSALR